jgi:two-component system nitrate/nitrite response regulator NarL
MPVEAIRILVVDDQPDVRRGLRLRFQLEPDFAVIGEAENGKLAVPAAAELQPDVIVMDLDMPGLNGIEASRVLKAVGIDAAIVILSIHDAAPTRDEAAVVGVHAFLGKHEPSEKLVAAIREAAASKKGVKP